MTAFPLIDGNTDIWFGSHCISFLDCLFLAQIAQSCTVNCFLKEFQFQPIERREKTVLTSFERNVASISFSYKLTWVLLTMANPHWVTLRLAISFIQGSKPEMFSIPSKIVGNTYRTLLGIVFGIQPCFNTNMQTNK